MKKSDLKKTIKKSYIKIIVCIMAYCLDQEIKFNVFRKPKRGTPDELFKDYIRIFETICENLFDILVNESDTDQTTLKFVLDEKGKTHILTAEPTATSMMPKVKKIFFDIIFSDHSKDQQEISIEIHHGDSKFYLPISVITASENINFEDTRQLLRELMNNFAAHLAYAAEIDKLLDTFQYNILILLDESFRTLGTQETKPINTNMITEFEMAKKRIESLKIIFKPSFLDKLPRLLLMSNTLARLMHINLDPKLEQEIINFRYDADHCALIENDESIFNKLKTAILDFFDRSMPNYLEEVLQKIASPKIILPESMNKLAEEYLTTRLKSIQALQNIYALTTIAMSFYNTLDINNFSTTFFNLHQNMCSTPLTEHDTSIIQLKNEYVELLEIEESESNGNVFITIENTLNNLDLDKLDGRTIPLEVKEAIIKFRDCYNSLKHLLTKPELDIIKDLENVHKTIYENQELNKVFNKHLSKLKNSVDQIMLHSLFQLICIKLRGDISDHITDLRKINESDHLSILQLKATQLLPLINKIVSKLKLKNFPSFFDPIITKQELQLLTGKNENKGGDSDDEGPSTRPI